MDLKVTADFAKRRREMVEIKRRRGSWLATHYAGLNATCLPP
jgi:hypothetical protein